MSIRLGGLRLNWPGSHFKAGSPPVGAVLVDRKSEVIARGRSRRGESSGPADQLAGSRLAHAEVTALAQLSIDQHGGLTFYATLEPCFLRAAAVAMSHVPLVPICCCAHNGDTNLNPGQDSIAGSLPTCKIAGLIQQSK